MKYSGLKESEVLFNREKYGSNKLDNHKKQGIFSLFLASLADPIVKILLIALGIKIVLFLDNFDFFETAGIVLAILVASIISTLSEYGSEKAFEKLVSESSKLKSKVIRENKILEINSDEIVKDDIIMLSSGEKIPADGIIIEGNISVDESSINGEAEPKFKGINDIIYMGTIITDDECTMKVTSVGFNTVYGKIASELKTKQVDTPLKIRLNALATSISKVGSFLAFIVAISYLISVFVLNNNFDFNLIIKDITNIKYLLSQILYALTLAVTVLIVAVPEGLPMMITLVLSRNMKKMIKKNVLVRKMNGIETAGNISMLFTDKTGTITTGNFKVASIIDGSLHEYLNYEEIKENKKYNKLIIKSLGDNNKCLFNDKIIGGNLTDQALFKYINYQKENLNIKKIVSFDSKYKYSYILTDDELIIKGACEVILNKCDFYYDGSGRKRLILNKNKILEKMNEITSSGSRVIACAIKETNEFNLDGLTLVCLINIEDEIKENMHEVINTLKLAGINVVMITGDNKDTAYAVGEKINIVNSKDEIITSEELNKLSDENLYDQIDKIKIIARALPSDKSRLVKIAQKKNYVVGMTGDGINDAPALKLADVGFSMGSGAEIAKEASDIVILDNNLKSITTSVLYGRTTFKNIRKFIMFQLTINICAITLSVIGPFIGVSTPITIMQMLWINMIMDTLAGLAFASSSPREDYLLEYPLKKDEKIISTYMKKEIAFGSIYISILLLLYLKLPFIKSIFNDELSLMTGFFALFIFISIFNAFNIRTHRLKITSGILKDKVFLFITFFILIVQIIIIYFGGELFRTTFIEPFKLLILIIISFSIIPLDLIRKHILKLKNKNVGV